MSERRFRAATAVVAAFAALSSLAYVPFMSRHTSADSAQYIAAARALMHGRYSVPVRDFEVWTTHGYADPTGVSWPRPSAAIVQSDAYRPPGYPALLAAVGGGRPGLSRDAVYAVQALLVALATFAVMLTARRLAGPRTALAAGALFALDPYSKRYVTLVLTETLAGALVALSAYAAVRAWQERSARWWAAAGALAGAATLVRPVFALAAALLPLAALLNGKGMRTAVLRALAAAVAALVIVAPWAVRTAAVSGKLTVAAYGSGWNLLIGAYGEGLGRTTNDVYADARYVRDFNAPHRFAPSRSRLLADRDAYARYLARADAVQRSRAMHVYGERISRHPARVLWEFLYRGYYLWMAHEDWFQPTGWKLVPLRLVDWTLLLLAAIGAAAVIVRGGAARMLGVFLIVYTAVTAIGHVEARYTVPLRGLYLMVAVFGVQTLLARSRAVHSAT